MKILKKNLIYEVNKIDKEDLLWVHLCCCNTCEHYDPLDHFCMKLRKHKNINEYCELYKKYNKEYTEAEKRMVNATIGAFLRVNNELIKERGE